MRADQEQRLELPLDFLGDGSYTSELFVDDPATGPTAVVKNTSSVSREQLLRVVM